MSQRNDQMDSHLAIATASIRVFANDGTLDQQELDSLLGLALRDGRIDAEEKRVLANIFFPSFRLATFPGRAAAPAGSTGKARHLTSAVWRRESGIPLRAWADLVVTPRAP